MIFISLSINFVNLLTDASGHPIFGIKGPEGINTDGKSYENISSNLSKQSSKLDILSILTKNIGTVITALGILGLGAVVLTGNWNVIAAYVFTVVFWGSWTNCLFVFHFGNYYSIPAVAAIILMITVGMFFLFIGAVIGLLHLGEG